MKLSPSISYKNLSNKLYLGSYHPCFYTSKNTVYTSKKHVCDQYFGKTWSYCEILYPRVALVKLNRTSYSGRDITTSLNVVMKSYTGKNTIYTSENTFVIHNFGKTWSYCKILYPRVALVKLHWTSYSGHHDITTSFNGDEELHWQKHDLY